MPSSRSGPSFSALCCWRLSCSSPRAFSASSCRIVSASAPMVAAGGAGEASMALLEIRGVSKTFRTLRALDGVDVDVEAGSFHGLIGPNGSGKSTLLKAIAGDHFADGGTIRFDGHDITRATPYERARAGLSLKFQITAVL